MKNNVLKFTPRPAPVPKSDRALIAEMKNAVLAATADGSVSERALLGVASPEGCLHCHQLAHGALKALVKKGLLVRTSKDGVNDYARPLADAHGVQHAAHLSPAVADK